jgi:hypothetical protein
VATGPRLNAFTRIFLGPSSFANERVIELSAALVPLYTDAVAGANSLATEPMQ